MGNNTPAINYKGLVLSQGLNTKVDGKGNIALQMKPFKEVGEKQSFIIYVHNPDESIANVVPQVVFDRNYFEANFSEQFSIEPHGQYSFLLEITLHTLPSESTPFSFALDFVTSYES
jgi:hypothetical protein